VDHGFGKDGEVNTGPWQLDLVSSDTGREAMQRCSQPPEPAGEGHPVAG